MPLMVVPEVWVEVVANLVKAVVLPTVLPNLIAPVPALIVSALAPLIVLVKEMLLPADDAPVEAAVIEAPKVTAPV